MPWETVAYAVISAVIFSLSYYLKQTKEPFSWSKLLATGIIGVVIGVVALITNIGNITDAWVITQLTTYAGAVALVDSWIKVILRRGLSSTKTG
jgi:uncharacterized membrane protein HdeD (DUF308 family)